MPEPRGDSITRYRGVNRRGRAEVGTISGGRDRVAWWVEHLFDKGWRSLSVTIDGEEVGGIGRVDPYATNGPRTWWAESNGRRTDA